MMMVIYKVTWNGIQGQNHAYFHTRREAMRCASTMCAEGVWENVDVFRVTLPRASRELVIRLLHRENCEVTRMRIALDQEEKEE
jgi:hypothetical protein